MGSTASKSKRPPLKRPPLNRVRSVCADPEGSYMLVYNDNADVFQFDPSQTFMVAYAIDDQTSPRFAHRKLTQETIADAKQVCLALVDKEVLPENNVRLFTASRHPDVCTVAGMQQSFREMAQRVGPNGLFIFHFSGHGLKIGQGQEWGLAPADFDYTEATFVTGSVLNRWLYEAGCKAQHILFVLDCCYAGGLGEEMTADDFYLRPGLYVMSACTAFETSLVLGPLGHSIFAYFLAYALRVSKFPAGTLPITKVFEECGTLSTSLSSLLISYNPAIGLKMGRMNPELRYFEPQLTSFVIPHEWMNESVQSLELGHGLPSLHPTMRSYEFVFKYYKSYSSRGLERRELCEDCFDWLQRIGDSGELSPLSALAQRGLLQVSEVLRAAVCSMMWSVASFQMEKDNENVDDPNLFLMGFLYVASAIEQFSGPSLTLEHLRESLEFYQAVLDANKVEACLMKQVMAEIKRDLAGDKESCAVDAGSQSVATSLAASASPSNTLTQQPVLEASEEATLQPHLLHSVAEQGIPEDAPELQSITAYWWVPLTKP